MAAPGSPTPSSQRAICALPIRFDALCAVRPGHRRVHADRPVVEDKGLFASLLTDDFLFNMRWMPPRTGPREDARRTDADDADRPGSAVPLRRRIPDPGAAGQDAITVEFKEFGVGLKFFPVVLGRASEPEAQHQRQ